MEDRLVRLTLPGYKSFSRSLSVAVTVRVVTGAEEDKDAFIMVECTSCMLPTGISAEDIEDDRVGVGIPFALEEDTDGLLDGITLTFPVVMLSNCEMD